MPSAFTAKSRTLVLASVLGCAFVRPARADEAPKPAATAQEGVDRGAELLASGDPGGAADAFEAAANRDPDSALAADALFSAAKLREERLAQPERAHELYRRIADDYPDSRVALAARRRATDLGPLLVGADSATALANWKDLLNGFANRPREESLAHAQDILDRYPLWSGRSEVLLWLGDQKRADGELDAAARLLAQARAVEPAIEPFELERREIDLALARGDLAAASRHAHELDPGADPGRRRVVADLRARVQARQRRQQLYYLAFAAIALCLTGLAASVWRAAGSPASALAHLRRPPVEIFFAVPVLAIVLLMSLAGHREIGPAVAIVGAAGVAFTWLSGVASRLRPRPWWRVLLHLVAVAVGVAAAAYVALHRGALLDQILETVRFGPDL